MDYITPSTITIAQELLGKKLLINKDNIWIGGYIVETEAYLGPDDQACHSYNWKRTPKVEAMYQTGGTIYVYTMHGHNMLNIVTKAAGIPEAILIRGLQPVDEIEIMLTQRGGPGFELTNGPGKLCKAMGITRELNGLMLDDGKLIIDEHNSAIPKEIITTARIGIPNKGEWTNASLRFYVAGNPYVSRLPKKEMKCANETWKR